MHFAWSLSFLAKRHPFKKRLGVWGNRNPHQKRTLIYLRIRVLSMISVLRTDDICSAYDIPFGMIYASWRIADGYYIILRQRSNISCVVRRISDRASDILSFTLPFFAGITSEILTYTHAIWYLSNRRVSQWKSDSERGLSRLCCFWCLPSW